MLCLLGLLLIMPVHAEDPVATVQKELRARKFYFGEIDGKANNETAAAIKRFQLSKGIDATGHLNGETVRALGGNIAYDEKGPEERKKLDDCSDRVRQFFLTRQTDDWSKTETFFADEVDYFYEQKLKRERLRDSLTAEDKRWPRREYTMLNRIASLLPDDSECAQVTVRMLTRVTGLSGQSRAETEDILLRLHLVRGEWKITALKILP